MVAVGGRHERLLVRFLLRRFGRVDIAWGAVAGFLIGGVEGVAKDKKMGSRTGPLD